MAKNDNPSVTVISEPFILSYPKLLKPEAYVDQKTGKAKGDPAYSFEALSELDALASWNILNKETGEWRHGKIEALLVSLAREKWGADFDVREAVKTKVLSWPFKSGDQKADDKGAKAEHYRGKKFWRAKALAEINGSPNEPSLYSSNADNTLAKILRSTEAGKQRISEVFYGGAICTAELNAVAGMSGDNKYVTFYVNSVVFEHDGERLGGGSNIERLRGVDGGNSDYDPTAGMSKDLDDEIPF